MIEGATTPSRLRAVTAYLAVSAGLVGFASLEFMLEPIQADFSMSPNQTIVVGQISGAACLFVVFLVGALADRLGDARVLGSASVVATIGAVLVGFAPNDAVLLIGLSINAMGTISMAIVGVSELNRMYVDRAGRARAFGLFAVIAPVVSIVIPLLTGVMVPHLGWRSVVAIWMGVALATFLLARRTIPDRGRERIRSELLTPALAGVALAGIALSVSFITTNARSESHRVHAAMSAGVGLIAMIALVVALRRSKRPTLDLRPLRARGSASILTVVFIVNGVNLFFFTYLLLQYRYHQSLLETAVFLIIPQATAAVGAVLGGRLAAKMGSARIGTICLVAAAALSSGAFLIGAESSPWLAVMVLAIASLPIAAAVGPVTQSVMELAPDDGVAATSAIRTAAANLGVGVAGLMVGTVIFDDLDADTALDITAYRQQADAFHLAGAICVVAYLVAAGLVVLHARRRGAVVIRR